MAMAKPTLRYRSAKTGEYVTEEFAVHHPATTVKETTPKKKGAK
jgi:hypothetical protein